jgi:glycerol uptake facilitator-like aquaporin
MLSPLSDRVKEVLNKFTGEFILAFGIVITAFALATRRKRMTNTPIEGLPGRKHLRVCATAGK